MAINEVRNTSSPFSVQENIGVTLKDFQIFNVWKVDEVGKKYNDGTPCHIIDQTTNRKYFMNPKGRLLLNVFY